MMRRPLLMLLGRIVVTGSTSSAIITSTMVDCGVTQEDTPPCVSGGSGSSSRGTPRHSTSDFGRRSTMLDQTVTAPPKATPATTTGQEKEKEQEHRLTPNPEAAGGATITPKTTTPFPLQAPPLIPGTTTPHLLGAPW